MKLFYSFFFFKHSISNLFILLCLNGLKVLTVPRNYLYLTSYQKKKQQKMKYIDQNP